MSGTTQLIDNATTSGLYGPFNFDDIGRSDNRFANAVTLYIKATGDATITMKGAIDPGETPLPVDGAEWTSSIITCINTRIAYVWFDINITSGAVSIWMEG